jgi:hypothetical protein
MMYNFVKFCLTFSLLCTMVVLPNDNQTGSVSQQLPPMETFLLEPIKVENASAWIPAVNSGLVINRSCQPKRNCLFSCVLPAAVHHTKTEFCPSEVARLLAEQTACYHEQNLPLTIFNGWQWEFSYSLCQFESVTYDLPRRGGCWEGCWEAILTQSIGSADFQWIQVLPSGKPVGTQTSKRQGSRIEIKTFNSIRTRNGYPKERQLQQ